MKNNLYGFGAAQYSNDGERLPSFSDVLELLVMNKMQVGDIHDIAEKVTAAFDEDLEEFDEDYDEPYDTLGHTLLQERLRPELLSENNTHKLISAGYTDCMDEAIRFLIEEENISPDHPIVQNLKTHLEQSRERILESAEAFDLENNNFYSCSSIGHTDNCRVTTVEESTVPFVNCQSPWNTG